ncbi:hypothetical protein J3R82DRAFT_10228 [Butyriboletus roseoflavus]|nr:hypothetical protein J3R82DRAFT_10228 [Butyriboletus roseoflavus]
MATRASSAHNWASWLGQSAHSLLTLTLVFSLLMSDAQAQYYFIINQPSASSSWANGSPYPFSWTKGLLDGLNSFDVELTRLHEDGLFLIAQHVPATSNTLNILLEDVPPGDDYFILCFNSSDSVVYSVSSRFTITDSSSAQSNPSPDASAPTVTISGGPNPLNSFAANLAVATNGAIVVLCAAFLGGAMTLC